MNHRKIDLIHLIYGGLRFVPIIRYKSVKHNTFFKRFTIFIYCK